MSEPGSEGAPPPGRHWQTSRAWAGALSAAWGLCVLGPPAALVAAAAAAGAGAAPAALVAGRAVGLAVLAALAAQTVLAARPRALDRPFGLDRVIRFHQRAAVGVAAAVVLHPLLALQGLASAGAPVSDRPWGLGLGLAAAAVLLAGVAAAVFREEVRLGYQRWRRGHRAMWLGVGLALAHALAMGAAPIAWGALAAVAAAALLWRLVGRHCFNVRRLRVGDVRQETHDTWTIELDAPTDRPLAHDPGQFMFLRLHRRDRPSEEHPFTIASSPVPGGPAAATIKKSGDFTDTVDRTLRGDGARVEGPFGRFSFVRDDPPALLLIAGGVGITPIMSMLRCLRDAGDDRPATLLCANRTEADILFRRELEAMPASVKVVHVLSKPGADWPGARGHVDEAFIRAHAGDALADAHAYVCGPPAMMRAVTGALRRLGLPRQRVHAERFTL